MKTKMKTEMQNNRGWMQSLPQTETSIVVQEVKNFRLPKNLTVYNTMLELNGVKQSLYQHLTELLYKNTNLVSSFSIEESWSEKPVMTVRFKTNTYTNSNTIKNQIDNLYSALLAVHSIKRNEAKLTNYYNSGKTHNKPY